MSYNCLNEVTFRNKLINSLLFLGIVNVTSASSRVVCVSKIFKQTFTIYRNQSTSIRIGSMHANRRINSTPRKHDDRDEVIIDYHLIIISFLVVFFWKQILASYVNTSFSMIKNTLKCWVNEISVYTYDDIIALSQSIRHVIADNSNPFICRLSTVSIRSRIVRLSINGANHRHTIFVILFADR